MEEQQFQPYSLKTLALKRVFDTMKPNEQLQIIKLLSPSYDFVVVDFEKMDETRFTNIEQESNVAMTFFFGKSSRFHCSMEEERAITNILEPALNNAVVLCNSTMEEAQQWLTNHWRNINWFAKEVVPIDVIVDGKRTRKMVLVVYFDSSDEAEETCKFFASMLSCV